MVDCSMKAKSLLWSHKNYCRVGLADRSAHSLRQAGNMINMHFRFLYWASIFSPSFRATASTSSTLASSQYLVGSANLAYDETKSWSRKSASKASKNAKEGKGTTTVSTSSPSVTPSISPLPSASPSKSPSAFPSKSPSDSPSKSPSMSPSQSPSTSPLKSPSTSPSVSPSKTPSASPSKSPSASPSTTSSPSPCTGWCQLGNDIDGENFFDYSGFSVFLSSNGSTLAIGAPLNDGANGVDSGHVRVYSWDGSVWNQVGNDIDGEGIANSLGWSVSLSADGNTIVIGAPLNHGTNGVNSGHVRVYSWNGSVWSQVGNDIDGENAEDRSGQSVSLSADGNTVAIGAPWNGANGLKSGHARVYSWNGSVWNQLGMDIDGQSASDFFGWSVSLSSDGSIVAIGAPANAADGGSGLFSGHVCVYSWDGSAWSQVGNDIDGENTDDASGYSVSLSADGNTIAIGAPWNDGANGVDSGHVRVYSWDGSVWNQVGSDIDGENADDASGYSVSLSADGNTIAIGAPSNDGTNGVNSGHVRVYSWNGSVWYQVDSPIHGESANDFSGLSVSLSADGNTVAIGAVNNVGNGPFSGHVRAYSCQ